MPTPATFSVALFVALLTIAAFPAVSGQDAPLAVGTLYFTPQLLQEPFTGSGSTGTPIAGTRVHAFSAAPPTAAAAQKVYLQTSMYAQTYATEFTYKFSEATQISGTVKAKIWVSCDYVAPFRPAHDTGGVNDLHGYRLEIRRGTASTAAAIAQSRVFTPVPTCTGPSSITELTPEATFASPADFDAGQIISARVLLWTVTGHESVAKNVHFLVNSTSRPASLVGAGLPMGPAGTGGLVSLVVNPEEATLEAAPGEEVHTNLTIQNPSDKAVNVTINATGAYAGAANSTPVEVPAKGEARAQVSAMPPASAKEGDSGTVTYHVFLGDKEVGNTTINVTVVASPAGSGTSTAGPGGPGATLADGDPTASSNETGGANSDGGDTPGLGVTVIAAAVAGVAFLVRRRHR